MHARSPTPRRGSASRPIRCVVHERIPRVIGGVIDPNYSHYVRQPSVPMWQDPHYADGAYAIIGRALESVVGMSYEEYITQHIFKPLGSPPIPNDRSLSNPAHSLFVSASVRTTTQEWTARSWPTTRGRTWPRGCRRARWATPPSRRLWRTPTSTGHARLATYLCAHRCPRYPVSSPTSLPRRCGAAGVLHSEGPGQAGVALYGGPGRAQERARHLL
jgi:hypothetical protein